MKGRLFVWALLVGFSLGSGVWASVSFAQETWTGTFSFTIKGTSQETDGSGNEKFLTSNQAFAGTVSLFVGEDGLTRIGNCYLIFSGTDGTTICIREVAAISTESPKSKSEKGFLVGYGDFTTTIEETPVAGIAYIDAKVTLKQDSSNDMISIALTGKVGGGANEVNENLVFSGTLNNTTLIKQAASLD